MFDCFNAFETFLKNFTVEIYVTNRELLREVTEKLLMLYDKLTFYHFIH